MLTKFKTLTNGTCAIDLSLIDAVSDAIHSTTNEKMDGCIVFLRGHEHKFHIANTVDEMIEMTRRH